MKNFILILIAIMTLLFSTSVVNAQGVCTEGHFGSLDCTNITETTVCNTVSGCNWTGSCTGTITGNCGEILTSDPCNYNTTSVCEWDAIPSVNLLTPAENNISLTGDVTFDCVATDDYDLENLTLFVWNSTGGINTVVSKPLVGSYDTNNQSSWPITGLPSDIYSWNCLAYDDMSQGNWAAGNYTLNVSVPAEFLNTSIVVTLLSPDDGASVSSSFDINFSVNVDSTCMGYWDYNPEEITDIPNDVPFIPENPSFRWDHIQPNGDWIATAGVTYKYVATPQNNSRNYTWNVRCVSAGYSWASANRTFSPSGAPPPSMSVTKNLLSSSTPNIGDAVEFQITIANTGASTISEVWIHDDYDNRDLSFDNVTTSCPIKSNLNDGPNVNSIVINVTPCISGTFDSGNTTVVFLNFTAISTGTTINTVELSFTENGSTEDNDTANVNIQSGGGNGTNETSSALNVNLIYPTNNSIISSNEFEMNFSVNATSTCMAIANISFSPSPPYGLPTGWDFISMNLNNVLGDLNVTTMLPNGAYTWSAMCTVDSVNWIWASANWTFVMNGSMPDCFGISDEGTCNADSDCTWEHFANACFIDCYQFDLLEGGNQSQCEGAFGGGQCKWETAGGWCDPAFGEMDKGFEGFSPCFDFDGNQTACDNNSDTCVWFSESYCPTMDDCQDVTGGSNHGWCEPNNFDWGQDFDCWNYDGNETGCANAEQTLGWACQWTDDPWYMGPYGAGDLGWCNPASIGGDGGTGGGFGGGDTGCWDYWDQTGCENAASGGLLCNWNTPQALGWCEEKGCWNYWDSGACSGAPASESCQWNSEFSYCFKEGCWDLGNESACGTSALDCIWYNNSYGGGGWCEENGCWNRDWTNSTYCEAKAGCQWNDPWCSQDGCWNYEADANDCVNNSGLNCQWMTSSNGWCEETRCWSYDFTNQTACENVTAAAGLDCTWDGQFCYEDYKECSEWNNMFECFNTGWCFWDETGNGTCSNPDFGPIEFFNPGCWAFNQAGESKCGNITTCTWNSGTSTCDDNGADANNGVQCEDINNSAFCNGIPMLSSCCSWNGTGCESAPQTTACWDAMQEPPVGGSFCDDYEATSSETICNQIAGDPWYMPCVWDNVSSKCGFAFDNFFGGDAMGFEFNDLNEGTCANAGGVWKSEQWTDASGNLQWDEWCEMGFGFGTEFCANSCWACEQQDNGSVWASADEARSACEQSTAGCVFFADSYAYNGYGWCDMNWGQQGNCDQNCWDCWDSSLCGDSNAGCKWFTDPWNDNMGWCDDKNIKTCDDECYNCWDQNNCLDSDAGCTWDTAKWFCTPEGTGSGGESSEICFDGIDNDADTFVDCADPGCMYDSFCGGSEVFGSNCPSIPNNDSCISETGCVWITDNWNNSWCDMEGAQCWVYDDDATACDNEQGCNYTTMDDFGKSGDSFCDINFTRMDSAGCWNYDNNTCDSQPGCTWMNDPWCEDNPGDQWCQGSTGWCDNEMWSCHNYDDNQTACGLDSNCGWITDWFNPDLGWCDPVCFSRNSSTCSDNVSGTYGVCELFNSSEMGWCEPENMFKGCWDHFNKNDCDANNESCMWTDDPFMPGAGFCSDKFLFEAVGGMDKSPPLELENEACSAGTNEQSDICFLGIKDDSEQFSLGVGVFSLDSTYLCNKKFGSNDPVFSGNETAKFYWYIDANGNQSGGCNATDNSALVGFDFKFKYEVKLQDNDLIETKVAYKCTDGQWSPSKIKLNAWPDKMCYMVRGGVVAINKEDLSKLSVLGLYDDTADVKIYATTANDTGSDTDVYDTIGPAWYSFGAADFKFEDCTGFVDADGDGLTPSNDPDCVDFLKYGYIDIEQGSKCNDNIDNDGNGLTDCLDSGCMYDLAYCVAADSLNDISAPKITWMESKEFMDGAFIGVDTDEPTNGTLFFFKNDSYCSNISNGEILLDWKLTNAFTDDDFNFWHDFYVDQVYFDENSLSYNFSTNTTYYYKTKVCDKNGNCALSACLNFTTATEIKEYFVGFDLPPPETGSALLEPLGKLSVNFNFGDSNDTIDGNSGLKINESTGRDVDLKFTNPNSTDAWSIDFIGSDFVNAQNINITDAFIVNETSTGETLVGMDSDKWTEMAQKLGVDQIKIEIPDGVASGENVTLKHCPDNATSLNDTRCVEISLDDVNCTFTTTTTVCWIPTSIGFSVFGITTSTETTTTTTTTTSGGGGGGAATGAASVVSYTKTWDEIVSGVTKAIAIDETTYAGVPFTGVEFTALNDLSTVKIKVNALSSAPTSTGAITYKAYKYLQLVETNFGSDDVSDTKIDFRVPKDWLTNNSVSKDNIALFRYANEAWEEQETILASEDDTTVYYEATTTGFSYFSIGQKSEEVVPEEPEVILEDEPETIISEEETVVEDIVSDEPAEPEEPEEKGSSKASIWWSLIIIIVVIVLLALFWKEGKLKKLFHHETLKKHGVHKPHDDFEKLENFIKTHLEKGHHREGIKESLLKAGWSEDKIEEILAKHDK